MDTPLPPPANLREVARRSDLETRACWISESRSVVTSAGAGFWRPATAGGQYMPAHDRPIDILGPPTNQPTYQVAAAVARRRCRPASHAGSGDDRDWGFPPRRWRQRWPDFVTHLAATPGN